MNTIHLQYMLEIERTGSISHAADNLYMNQPTLSKIVKELESQVGIKVFERSTKGVHPTETGRRFLHYSRSILEQEEMINKLASEEEREKYALKISVPRASYISYVFAKFYESYGSNISCEFCETNSVKAIKNVAKLDHNFGIIRYNEDYETYFHDYIQKNNLISCVLWSFNYDVIMSVNSPLALMERLSDEQLKDYCEILHGDMQIPYLLNNETKNRKDNVIYVYERGSQFDILSAVKTTYMKVSPVPKEILHRANLVEKSYTGNQNMMKDVLIYREGYEFCDYEELLINKLFKIIDIL